MEGAVLPSKLTAAAYMVPEVGSANHICAD